jgi:hypothetical protein
MAVRTPDSATRHAAEGEAALFLIKSLLITLVERGVLTTEQALEAVEAVIATKHRMVEEQDEPRISAVAAELVSRIANTLTAITHELKKTSGTP